ncbi:MAG: hypothetical protein FJZ96_00215 [Chloroflexi bacterium]|nr:hypothetical protein [Chloroflexota bacterium]
MTVRSLDLLDLPFLSRYRHDVLCLDSARLLTRGNPLGAAALLAYLDPRRNIYTAVAAANGDSLMGQVVLGGDNALARLTFLAPAASLDGQTLPLLEHLSSQAGEWGALHIIAEVEEESPVFKSLRQAGFAIYAWQRVWQLPRAVPRPAGQAWRDSVDGDWAAVQSLRGQIVPALLQPIENLPKQASGLVCRLPAGSHQSTQGELQAYMAVTSGALGVWLQPLVLPDSGCGPAQLAALPGWGARPVYICVRSYQAWLESALEELGAKAGARQAVMVKRLAKAIKEPQAVPAMEKALAKAKPAAPASRVESEK